MARNSRRNKRRSVRGQRNKQFPWKGLLGGASLATILAVTGFFIVQDASYAQPNIEGCYELATNSAHTVAIIDSSDPRFDPAQTRDLMTSFRQLLASDMGFGERLSIVTTESARIGSVPDPLLSFCRSARTKDELESVGAAKATSQYLIKQAEIFADKIFEPVLAKIFEQNPDDGQRQRNESPILEQIQGVARMINFSPQITNRRLILVSDLIQTTQEAQFCTTQGHLPNFETFKQSEYFQRIKPSSLEGVDVKIYMLLRGEYGGTQRPYCASEDELSHFWHNYFIEAGASNVDIVRLRQGQ